MSSESGYCSFNMFTAPNNVGELGGTEGLIPRYALIDKSGAIYLDNASRPSDGEKLVQQIQSLLESQ